MNSCIPSFSFSRQGPGNGSTAHPHFLGHAVPWGVLGAHLTVTHVLSS